MITINYIYLTYHKYILFNEVSNQINKSEITLKNSVQTKYIVCLGPWCLISPGCAVTVETLTQILPVGVTSK